MTSRGIRLGVDALLAAEGLREWIHEGWAFPADVFELPPGTAEAAAAHRGRLSAALPSRRIAVSAGEAQHCRFIVCGMDRFLGLDVHDCAAARPGSYRDGPLAEGMALTEEPGLYFHGDDLTVPLELRGLGVRIEDDVVVTKDGYDLLSADFPVSAHEVKAWVS
ncbi:M24 family metallopeptidase [Amycolatopsis sp. NPDC051061]|uniref:M24 family metallopeptidase n=1 Tax=Amycolatopsis sp. NPDC051061 TaxID=3155042 RepID=UPI003429D713